MKHARKIETFQNVSKILKSPLQRAAGEKFWGILGYHSIDFVTTICNNCKFETAREALKKKIETFQISFFIQFDFFIQFEKKNNLKHFKFPNMAHPRIL